MNTLELIEVGDSLRIILPAEVLARLKLGDGDTLLLTDTANGFRLTTQGPDAVDQPSQGSATSSTPGNAAPKPGN